MDAARDCGTYLTKLHKGLETEDSILELSDMLPYLAATGQNY